MKVTLLAINTQYIHSSLAIWYLAEGVKRYARQDHDVSTMEATINQKTKDIAVRAAENKPDLVGISTYIWNAGKLPELIEYLRCLLPDVKILLGGPEASCNAEYWIKNGADYVLCGEGEYSFPMFLDAFAKSDAGALEMIAGLCFCKDREITVLQHCNDKSGADSVSLNEYINPYSDEYFERLSGRIAYIETSRGCPFSCSYCLSGSSSYEAKKGVRFFPLDDMKERIYALSLSGTQTIKFVDRTFNCNSDRAYAILEYVIGLDSPCCFHFEVAADLFDGRTLELLHTAPPGRIQLEAGLQSFHGPTLDAVSRKTNLEKTKNNLLYLLAGKNIHIHVDLIAGLPFETLDIFQDSFHKAFALGAHTLQIGFLKLIHGSRLREQVEDLGIVYCKEPPYEIIRNPWLSEQELKIIKTTENALQHTYNKGRFLSVISYVLSVSGLHPFMFFRGLGEAVFNQATPLDVYAECIFHHCAGLPHVDRNELHDRMICDLLGMTKGKCMPSILKSYGKRRKQEVLAVNKRLGRVIDYDETAILSSGRGVYVDSMDRDLVTGLYKLYFIE